MYKKVISILLVICLFISCFTFYTLAVDFPSDLKVNGRGFVSDFRWYDSGLTYICELIDTVETSYIEFIIASDVIIPDNNYVALHYFEQGDDHFIVVNHSSIGSANTDGDTTYFTRFWADLSSSPSIDSFRLAMPGLVSPGRYFELYSIWFGTGPSFSNVSVSGAYQLEHGDKTGSVYTFAAAPSQTYTATDDIFQIYIMPDQMVGQKSYDFLEFEFMCAGVSITSVSVAYGDKILPVSYDNYINGDLSENIHFIRCLLDLSIIDRNTSITDTNTLQLELVVTGTCNIGDVVYFGSFGIDGFVINTLPSAETSWLKKLWNTVTDGFDSVIAALGGNSSQGEAFDNTMQDKLNQMQQANESLNSIDKPNPDTVGDISGIIDSSSSAALSPVLSSLTGSDTFIQIMLLVVTFMLVGFVLFGKK